MAVQVNDVAIAVSVALGLLLDDVTDTPGTGSAFTRAVVGVNENTILWSGELPFSVPLTGSTFHPCL